jgi:hypothetical protein
MSTVDEMTQETAEETRDLAGAARKAAYAAVGAPVLAGRRIAEAFHRLSGTARKEFDVCAEEGERFTSRMRERPVVEDLKVKVDLSQIQDRMGRWREQLEGKLKQRRETLASEEAGEVAEPAHEAESTDEG